VLFGHFEDHQPKWKRVSKIVIVTALVAALAPWLGRAYALGLVRLSCCSPLSTFTSFGCRGTA
jgi:hypothetical protein